MGCWIRVIMCRVAELYYDYIVDLVRRFCDWNKMHIPARTILTSIQLSRQHLYTSSWTNCIKSNRTRRLMVRVKQHTIKPWLNIIHGSCDKVRPSSHSIECILFIFMKFEYCNCFCFLDSFANRCYGCNVCNADTWAIAEQSMYGCWARHICIARSIGDI